MDYGLEIICVEIKPLKCRPFIIVAWYRPPSDPVISFDLLEKVLSSLDSEQNEIILIGDTNCDFSDKAIDSDYNSMHLSNVYDLFSFKQLIQEPTRENLGSRTIIDHIATNVERNIGHHGVIRVSMSDHYLVYCIRKLNGALKRDHKVITTRVMKRFSEIDFLDDVAKVPWEQVVQSSNDINELVIKWSSLFSSLIDKHAPYRKIRVSEKFCPWISTDLKYLIRRRDQLKQAAVRNNSMSLMMTYRNVRNQVTTLNRQLKKQYFAQKITKEEGNMKATWQIVNQFLNKRSKSTSINSLTVDGREILQKDAIANSMNKYFCSIGNDLANEIPYTPNPLLNNEYTVNTHESTFRFSEISAHDVAQAMNQMKTTKSVGTDKISSYFLKLAIPYVSKSIAQLLNISTRNCIFPESWKTARVTPIFKEGDKSEPSNYRPISVLPVLTRLFEKLIFSQLYKYLNDNNLLSQEQSGFRTLHSTVSCLLKSTDDWYSAFDNSEIVGATFVDLRKAFDTVDHSLLCGKLERYGVRNNELRWFVSYLAGRKQFCRVNGTDSQVNAVDIGVPQGSCLGPLLFLVYINDLPKVIESCTVAMYADDTGLYYRGASLDHLNETINKDLERLDNWLKGNKLSLNVVKTVSMNIVSRQKHQKVLGELDLKIRDTNIQNVKETKYLGLQIDRHLTWKKHVDTISRKVSRVLGVLKHAKKFLPQNILKNLYISIIEPHFRYCSSVWGCCSTTYINRLQKLQNRAVRIITNSAFDTPAKPLLANLGLRSISELNENELRLITYKSLNDLAPNYLRQLLIRNSQQSCRALRNTDRDLKLPLKRTNNGQKGYSFRGAKSWNSLSAGAKCAPSLASFKTYL